MKKTFLPLLISAALMSLILWKVDLRDFWAHVRGLDGFYFLTALFLFVPQTLITAWRWQLMVKSRVEVSLWNSLGLVLSASTLNVFLPSKLGDFCKAFFLKKEGKMDLKRGANIVLFERYIDLASLGALCLFGVIGTRVWNPPVMAAAFFSLAILSALPVFYLLKFQSPFQLSLFNKLPGGAKLNSFLEDSHYYLAEIRQSRASLLRICGLSFLLWFLHLFQFYLVFQAVSAGVSIFKVLSLVPLAILVGLLPFSIAGIGTRDAAFLYLFSAYTAESKILFIGLFASLRYFVPGLCGVPFFHKYISKDELSEKRG